MQQEQVTLLLTQGLGAFWELASLSTLAARATSIALELAHPAYDCFYLALADLHKTVLVTADSRLLQRVAGTPWEARARLLTA